jgi:hypothetical protein
VCIWYTAEALQHRIATFPYEVGDHTYGVPRIIS